ncbi:MAG TPA: universal stress protein [Lactococcus sp.]|uniref:Universal stress protein n=1 Tax=Lactococcus muris TaxID=2941330 RepID=A0ABV4D8H5_9LACT|nr:MULTISPECIES: universal stress protein [Lactococcus]HBC90377.1 universal stress protein [Lactococcus sp.]
MKENYKNVLVAVDGSEQSNQAIQEAVEISKKNQASLLVVHVKDVAQLYGSAYIMPTVLEEAEKQSAEILDEAGKIIGDKVEYKTFQVSGSPKKEIVDFAEANDVDLIVLGSTGKGAIDRVLVGSTASYVVNHAPCNVMVVK